MMNDANLVKSLGEIAIKAGAAINEIYAEEFNVETKSDGSPVTIADETAEKIILAGLNDIAPHIPVLAEESASAGNIDEIGAKLGSEFFLVDPLDGTREFVNRTGEFTVNIALIRDGYPVLGVVYTPAQNVLYAGAKDYGATKSTGNGPAEKITTRDVPDSGLIAVASRSHRSPETETLLQEMQVKDFVAAGSSLKFCLVAEGKADTYPRLGRTMELDTGAGQAVLEAAGGRVLDYPGGERLAYGKRERGFDNPYFICHGR